jgi:hypothetical protein
MRPVNSTTAAEEIKAIDEKIRSVLMALSFFVAGMVTVVYATRAGTRPPEQLAWDGHHRNPSTVFMVMFGGSVFFAVMWALTALDPQTYRPMFIIGESKAAQWSDVAEARFKARRFAESQAFVGVIVATAVLLGITQLPTTSSGTKTALVAVALITFSVAPSIATISLWRYGLLRSGTAWLTHVFPFYVAVPAAAVAFTVAAFVLGAHLKWIAVAYTLFWLLVSRLVQHRTATVRVGRSGGRRLAVAELAAAVWLSVACFILVGSLTGVWPGVLGSVGASQPGLPADITPTGVGGVRPGMTAAAAARTWGVRLQLLQRVRGTLSIGEAVVCAGPMEGVASFSGRALATVWFSTGATTAAHVGIGSTEAALRRAYGTRLTRAQLVDVVAATSARSFAIAFWLTGQPRRVTQVGLGAARALAAGPAVTGVHC